jgi:hypothetical protein
VIESVNYKNTARATHRRRIIDQTTAVSDRVREAGITTKLRSDGLVKIDKRTKAYKMSLVRCGYSLRFLVALNV